MVIKNKNSFGNESLGSTFVKAQGRSHINSVKTKDFFKVDLEKSRSNSYQITIHGNTSPLVLDKYECSTWGFDPRVEL